MNVGKGYFFLEGKDRDALCNALMLSPYKTKWGTCMLQSWVPGLNPDNPSNLPFPTWIALRNLPFEHHDQAMSIAETLGEVIGIDTANETARAPRFYVHLKVDKGWVTNIMLEFEEGVVPPQKVMVDYDKLPLRCRACHSWQHKVRDCSEIHDKTRKGHGKPLHTRPTNTHDKGKTKMVDDEGFQQVRSRKNTRRNIFENVDDDLRKQAYEQRSAMRQPTDYLIRDQITEGEYQTANEVAATAAALGRRARGIAVGEETMGDLRESAEPASEENQEGTSITPGPRKTNESAATHLPKGDNARGEVENELTATTCIHRTTELGRGKSGSDARATKTQATG